jgi:SAM-dependent methyltransferase
LTLAFLRHILEHPLTAGMDLDDPATTRLRKQVIFSKPLLKAIYDEWYGILAEELPAGEGPVLELGSGAGYCEQFIPGLITSELLYCPSVQLRLDAQRLPFEDESLKAIIFTGVLHHIPNVRLFFSEAERCIRHGGKILMIEPWVTAWSRFAYKHLHHEPFSPEATEWSFPSSGPLSDANIAIPWIVFERDRRVFESEFPQLEIERIRPFMPFRYIVSGGLGMRNLVPAFTHAIWLRLERILDPWMSHLGMYAFISLRRR